MSSPPDSFKKLNLLLSVLPVILEMVCKPLASDSPIPVLSLVMTLLHCDFPAEIRAPAGTLAGVSRFQLQFGSRKILTQEMNLDALVAMNPAALRANIDDLPEGGMLVVNIDSFKKMNLSKAGYESNPLEDEDFRRKFHLVGIGLNQFDEGCSKESPLKPSRQGSLQEFLCPWIHVLCLRKALGTNLEVFNDKWSNDFDLADANSKALKAGYNLGDTMETARNRYQVSKAPANPGLYRKISGNEALVYGLVAGAQKSKRELCTRGLSNYLLHPFWKVFLSLKNMELKLCRQRMKSLLWEWRLEQVLPEILQWLPPVALECV